MVLLKNKLYDYTFLKLKIPDIRQRGQKEKKARINQAIQRVNHENGNE